MDLKFKDNSQLRLAPFTRLEYIESTGTQYVDTGIAFPNGFRSVTKLYPTNVSSYKDYAGAYQQNLHNIHRIFNGRWNPCTQNDGSAYYGTVNTNTLYTVDMSNANSKYNLIVNGSILANNVSTPTGYSSLTCWLFALHRIDNTDYQYYYGRIYEVSLYDENNVLKFHGIPALDTNNVVCMYDTVSQTLFYNQGTGDFIAGPVVSPDIPYNILLKTTTLYHENTPNINGRQLLNCILNYQKTHQDEVKEYYYTTTQLWQDIITEYPDIVQYYDMNHKLCILICEANDPEQFTEDLLPLLEDYPDITNVIVDYPTIAPIIIDNPEVVHSLIDTGYEPYLANNTNAYIDTGIIMRHTYNSYFKFQPVSYVRTYNCILGARYAYNSNAYYFGYTSGRSYVELSPSNTDPFTPNFNAGVHEITIVNGVLTVDGVSSTPNYSQDTDRSVYLFKGNGENEPSNSKISYFKVENNNNPILWLVPIQNNGNPCMIDLLTGTKYLNQGTGSFTYSLEPKNS